MNDRDLLQAGFRYALSLRANRHDAEDLVQEAWYRLHRRAGRVDGKAVLFTTIRHAFVDRYRRESLVVLEPLDDADAPDSDDGEGSLDARLTARDLEAPLASLRAEEREALFLGVVEGYTAEEIGALTGRPRGTVLSVIHRAKRKLRRAIEARDADAASAGGSGR
jgi:RNA polymerase sigma-70 factor (ECF subfamily)